MPPDRMTEWSALSQFASDPVLLAGLLLPFVMVAVLLYIRIRGSRRLAALTKRNDEMLRQNTARWEESAARSDRMIALLTEIRDHLAAMAPPAHEDHPSPSASDPIGTPTP